MSSYSAAEAKSSGNSLLRFLIYSILTNIVSYLSEEGFGFTGKRKKSEDDWEPRSGKEANLLGNTLLQFFH